MPNSKCPFFLYPGTTRVFTNMPNEPLDSTFELKNSKPFPPADLPIAVWKSA